MGHLQALEKPRGRRGGLKAEQVKKESDGED